MLNKLLPKATKNVQDYSYYDMVYFGMHVLHQPYSEIMELPYDELKHLAKAHIRFNKKRK